MPTQKMITRTYPATSNVIPKPRGQWRRNKDGSITTWTTEPMDADIMLWVGALEMDFEEEQQEKIVTEQS